MNLGLQFGWYFWTSPSPPLNIPPHMSQREQARHSGTQYPGASNSLHYSYMRLGTVAYCCTLNSMLQQVSKRGRKKRTTRIEPKGCWTSAILSTSWIESLTEWTELWSTIDLKQLSSNLVRSWVGTVRNETTGRMFAFAEDILVTHLWMSLDTTHHDESTAYPWAKHRFRHSYDPDNSTFLNFKENVWL